MRSWLFTCVMVATLGWAGSASAACHMIFVHGRGPDRRASSDAALEEYWNPRNAWQTDTYDSFTTWAARDCRVHRLGYDGTAYWWSTGAAGEVANDINALITAHGIQANEIILVGHSMGGVVLRWILDNGSPGAPYYNFEGRDYARIVSRSRYLITVQSPHWGSPLADAVRGEGDTSWVADVVGFAASVFTSEDNDSAASLTTPYMESAASWMGDAGRSRTIYTVASYGLGHAYTSGTHRSHVDSDQGDMSLAASALCYDVDDWDWNTVLCGYWPWEDPSDTPFDGVVREDSGAGIRRSGGYFGGPRSDWVRIAHSHGMGRFDSYSGAIRRVSDGWSTTSWPGYFIGSYGRNF